MAMEDGSCSCSGAPHQQALRLSHNFSLYTRTLIKPFLFWYVCVGRAPCLQHCSALDLQHLLQFSFALPNQRERRQVRIKSAVAGGSGALDGGRGTSLRLWSPAWKEVHRDKNSRPCPPQAKARKATRFTPPLSLSLLSSPHVCLQAAH
ncbi:hypothetical protein SRHO_G00044630 [Serrasalmus rhombeus]